MSINRGDFIGFVAGLLVTFAFLFGFVVAMPIALMLLAICIRIGATLIYLRPGIAALPRNFRRLAICTSPAQIPELVPGLNSTESRFAFKEWLDPMVFPIFIFFFLPPWLYRVTIKSTAWFWWPLAFLGGDVKRIRRPEVFHWKVLRSLWARTSIALTLLSVLAFAAANLAVDGAMFERPPLLTPMGYLMLVDWKLGIWQVCVLSAAGLSMLIVYMVNDVSGQYQIAQDTQDAELLEAATSKFGWIERLMRIRFLLLLGFWGLVGTHAVLYFNSQQCWFSLPPMLHEWAKDIYGDRLPHCDKCEQ